MGLFLNRTNRSGIIKAGVIGGLDQSGTYKLDCRFMKADLVQKVRRIAAVRSQVKLTKLDAVKFISDIIPTTSTRTLVNLDPPYFGKGPDLYTNFYRPEDHSALAKAIRTIKRRWMVTYDDAVEIRKIYASYPTYTSALNYSAQEKKVGSELLVLDPAVIVPGDLAQFKVVKI